MVALRVLRCVPSRRSATCWSGHDDAKKAAVQEVKGGGALYRLLKHSTSYRAARTKGRAKNNACDELVPE